MTLTSTLTTADLRRPAGLLILTLPAYVAYVALAATTLATKVDSSSSELTSTEVSDLGLSWAVLHALWMTPPVLAAIALLLIARRMRLGSATAVAILSVTALALAVAYLVPQLLAFGIETDTWGDSSLYGIGVVLSLAVGWIGTLPATVLVAVRLSQRGIAPRTAWAVAVLTGLYLLWELLTYLQALGTATLAETTGPPPVLLGILWTVLGGGLLRHGTARA